MSKSEQNTIDIAVRGEGVINRGEFRKAAESPLRPAASRPPERTPPDFVFAARSPAFAHGAAAGRRTHDHSGALRAGERRKNAAKRGSSGIPRANRRPVGAKAEGGTRQTSRSSLVLQPASSKTNPTAFVRAGRVNKSGQHSPKAGCRAQFGEINGVLGQKQRGNRITRGHSPPKKNANA